MVKSSIIEIEVGSRDDNNEQITNCVLKLKKSWGCCDSASLPLSFAILSLMVCNDIKDISVSQTVVKRY